MMKVILVLKNLCYTVDMNLILDRVGEFLESKSKVYICRYIAKYICIYMKHC